jgi:hypothetical protein
MSKAAAAGVRLLEGPRALETCRWSCTQLRSLRRRYDEAGGWRWAKSHRAVYAAQGAVAAR